MRKFLIAFSAFVFSTFLVFAASAQTVREMAGQMIMVGFQHKSANTKAHKKLVSLVKNGQIGGVMYLKYNVESLKSVASMNRSLRSAAPAGKPLLISIDQEAGLSSA